MYLSEFFVFLLMNIISFRFLLFFRGYIVSFKANLCLSIFAIQAQGKWEIQKAFSDFLHFIQED